MAPTACKGLERSGEAALASWCCVFGKRAIRLRRRHGGNVGIPPAVGGIPKGLVERGGSLLLAFHAFHSTVISTVPASHGLRQRANNSSLTFCMRRAASVSLIADAWPCSIPAVIPSFKHFSQSVSDRSFS